MVLESLLRGSYMYNAHTMLRNISSELFCKKGVIKTFAKFTRKHLCHSLKHLGSCMYMLNIINKTLIFKQQTL